MRLEMARTAASEVREAVRWLQPTCAIHQTSALSSYEIHGYGEALSGPSPRANAAPFGRIDVSHRLRQLPAVPRRVGDEAGPLAVNVRLRLLEDAGTRVAGTRTGGVDVADADLDHLRDDVTARSDLRATNVCDHDRAIGTDLHLRAVVVANPHALPKPEGSLEERDRRTHVGVNQYRCDGRRWRGAIGEHVPTLVSESRHNKRRQR
jgi:hypothetical protein